MSSSPFLPRARRSVVAVLASAGLVAAGLTLVPPAAAAPTPDAESSRTVAAAVPDAPVVTLAIERGDTVRVSWPIPSDNGSPITSYTTTLTSDRDAPRTATTTSPTAAFVSLRPGATYAASVTARNGAGDSAAGVSEDSATVSPITPGEPYPVTATAGSDGGSATITWGTPSDDGGSRITQYRVTLRELNVAGSPVGQPTVVAVAPDVRSHTFTGLHTGRYRLGVASVNAVGSQPPRQLDVVLTSASPTLPPVRIPDTTLVDNQQGPVYVGYSNGVAKIFAIDFPSTWIAVTLHSDPVFIGWYRTDERGIVSVPIRAGLAPRGEHYIVMQDMAGGLLGYQLVDYPTEMGAGPGEDIPTDEGAADGDGPAVSGSGPDLGAQASAEVALAATGQDADALGWSTGAALVLLVMGGILVAVRRRLAA